MPPEGKYAKTQLDSGRRIRHFRKIECPTCLESFSLVAQLFPAYFPSPKNQTKRYEERRRKERGGGDNGGETFRGRSISRFNSLFFCTVEQKKSSFSFGASKPRGPAGLDKPRHGRNSNLTFSGPTSTWAVVDTSTRYLTVLGQDSGLGGDEDDYETATGKTVDSLGSQVYERSGMGCKTSSPRLSVLFFASHNLRDGIPPPLTSSSSSCDLARMRGRRTPTMHAGKK